MMPRVAISGLDLFTSEVADLANMYAAHRWRTRLLRTNSRTQVVSSIYALLQSDVWYSIGRPTDKWLANAARAFGIPRVVHWVGSDILYLQDRVLREEMQNPHIVHLAEVDWTQLELQNYGIVSHIAPLPPRLVPGAVTDLPREFTVLVYVPAARSAWYGTAAVEALMKQLADEPVRYVVAGGGALDAPAGVNVQNVGWVEDLRAVYEASTVLIRFTPRDGLSLMVLEALALGRHVIWTQPFPYSNLAQTSQQLETTVRSLLQRHKDGTLTPQRDAAGMILREYSQPHCMAQIAAAWTSALSHRGTDPIGHTASRASPLD